MRQRVLFVAVLVVLVWIGGAIAITEGSLRVPRRAAWVPPEMEREIRRDASAWSTVSMPAADGILLKAWWIEPRMPGGRCVMVLHGIAADRSPMAGFSRVFLQHGYSVLLPDSRAHGESGGHLVTYGLRERDDLLRWTDWMRDRGCRAVFGLGESLGAAFLIMAAAERPAFHAVVAEGAYRDMRSIARERVAQAMPLPDAMAGAAAVPIVEAAFVYARLRYGVAMGEVSPLEAARRLRTPLLLIHGTADVNTLPWHSEALASAAPGSQLWLVPGAAHTAASASAPEEFNRRVLAFFDQAAAPPAR